MNAQALRYLEIAIEIENENRELRRIATALLAWIASNRELLELARVEASRNWGSDVH